MRRYVGARLHRRVFAAMGGAILALFVIVVGTLHFTEGGFTKNDGAEIERFFATAFEQSWEDPAARRALTERGERAFGVKLALRDASGALLDGTRGCDDPKWSLALAKDGIATGRVDVCEGQRFSGVGPGRFLGLFALALFMLWLAAGFIAHRLGRPLWQLVQVTRELGEGKLSSRARLLRGHHGEVGILAESINEMAARIERQLAAQKELLASVSHEIRTPLARLGVIAELLREKSPEEAQRLLDELEREVHDIDDLTGRLLASVRLDHASIDQVDVDAADLVRRTLTRHGERAELFEAPNEAYLLRTDPTLLGRALGNLLENARAHANGATAIRLEEETLGGKRTLVFVVEDSGPGFSPDELKRAFEPFYRGGRPEGGGTSLGLGLHLVRRIAEALGGRVRAENRSEGGARVRLTVPASVEPR